MYWGWTLGGGAGREGADQTGLGLENTDEGATEGLGMGLDEGKSLGEERAGGPELGNRPETGGAVKGAGTLRTTGGLGGDVERTGSGLEAV